MGWWWGRKAQAAPKVPVSWDFHIRRVAETIHSIALNLALADPSLRPKALRVVLRLKIKLRQPTKEGVTSEAEHPAMLDMEEIIADDLATPLGALFVGHILGGGYWELVLYVRTTAIASAIASQVRSRYPDHEILVSAADDPTWSVYMQE